ncbi:MAG: DUF4177 domain-containing protein [Candidatus Margulisiibacteriota bacterium]|nr:DUF4177 domain-containing protein [Candidatus Margulisiibacteriota bacterium]
MTYKVVVYKEGLLGSLLLGASRINPIRFSEFLNQNAADGWEVVTMEKDIRREFIFFRRESYVVIMGKKTK